jgi:hypothetical protein
MRTGFSNSPYFAAAKLEDKRGDVRHHRASTPPPARRGHDQVHFAGGTSKNLEAYRFPQSRWPRECRDFCHEKDFTDFLSTLPVVTRNQLIMSTTNQDSKYKQEVYEKSYQFHELLHSAELTPESKAMILKNTLELIGIKKHHDIDRYGMDRWRSISSDTKHIGNMNILKAEIDRHTSQMQSQQVNPNTSTVNPFVPEQSNIPPYTSSKPLPPPGRQPAHWGWKNKPSSNKLPVIREK